MSTTSFSHQGRKVETGFVSTASAEQVWRCFAEARVVAQWLVDHASGAPHVGTEMVWGFETPKIEAAYRVIESIPDRRLVLKSDRDEGLPDVLEIDIEPSGDGRTKLTLVNSGIPEDDDARLRDVQSGWSISMAILQQYLQRHFGREKSSKTIIREISAGEDQIYKYFITDEIEHWIGDITKVQEDRPYRLQLESGGELTGRFLAVTGSEVLLGADQLEGTVEFKNFTLNGDKRCVGLRLLSWRLSDAQMSEIAPMFMSAVDRLVKELRGDD